MQSIRTPLFDHIFVVIAIFFSPYSVAVASTLISFFFYIQQKKRAAIHLLLATFLISGATEFFKLLIHVQRPTGFTLIDDSSSFPSGHTAVTVTVLFFIAYLCRQLLSKKWSPIPFTIATLLTLLVIFSRLYLGAHWLSDVVGGVLLGTTILLLCIISYHRNTRHTHLPVARNVLLLLMSFCLPSFFLIPRDYAHTLLVHTAIVPQKITSIDTWWNSPLSITPVYRSNRLGTPYRPFNVQWQGSLNDIKKNLEARGWEEVPKKQKLKSALERFASMDAKYHMSIFPLLYHNTLPALVMIKPEETQESLIELHLWRSEVFFYGHESLWIGSTDIRIAPKKLLSLRGKAKISLEDSAGLDELFSDTKHFDRKYVHASTKDLPKDVKALAWNGKVLVIRED